MGEYKNREQWSTATDKKLLKNLRNLSASTRIPMTRLLDEAIEDLLVKHGIINKNEKKRAIKILRLLNLF